MSKAPSRKKAPRAGKTKRFLHAFYLVQPLLQFFALILMIGILGACSPLAPSTDKLPKPISTVLGGESSRADAEAQEQLVQKNLKEISVNDLVILSDSKFESQTREALSGDSAFNEGELDELLKKRRRNPLRKGKLAVIQLSADKQSALWRDGTVRLSLADAFPKGEAKAKKMLARLLKEESDKLNLDAVGHLVLPDAAMHDEYSDISLQIRVSLAVLADDRAYIEIRRMTDEENRETNAALLEPAIRASRQLAITLE